MDFFTQMGLGLLMNIVGSIQQKSQMEKFREMQQQNLQTMQNVKFQQSQAVGQTYEQPNLLPQLDFEVPPFPEKYAKNFQNTQLEQLAMRENFSNKFKADLFETKENYFRQNHYETKDGSVSLRADGKPIVTDSGENSAQRTARLKYEQTLKQDLAQNHIDTKEKFLSQERSSMLAFLNDNVGNLANPIIQGEIQQRLIETQKKALKIAREQDEEIAKVDLPIAEMEGFLETNIRKLHQMEDEHFAMQQNSFEGKILKEYQDSLTNALTIKKEEIKDMIFEQDLLQKPAYYAKPDLAATIPPHLLDALAALEIYNL